MAKKISKKELSKSDYKNKILQRFEEFTKETSAIREKYYVDENALTSELQEAEYNFHHDITFEDEPETTFEEVKSYIDSKDDIGQILSYLDVDDIIYFLKEKGYQFLKIQSADKLEKLKEFLCTEIYPDYNEQVKFIDL